MIGKAAQPANACGRVLSAAASDNATAIVAVPAVLKGLQGYVAKASAVYLKIYDKATAPIAADTPVKTLRLPETASFAIDFPAGIAFSAGIGIRITGAAADNDATALVAGDVLCLNVDYAR